MKKVLFSCSLSVIFLLGGCMAMMEDKQNDNNENSETSEEEFNERYVNVNEYTGEGYRLPYGEKTDPIAQEKFAEIEEEMLQFFLDEYKTEVIVHNAVGSENGATVFVESVGKPHFHVRAKIGIDVEEREIIKNSIWTEPSRVEQGIFGGLLAMIMEEEFAALDAYIEEVVEEHPIVGLRQEAVNNVKATAYTTPYYFVQPMALKEEMQRINELYFNDPNISKEELIENFDKTAYDTERLFITVNFYMEEEGESPDEGIFDEIVEKFNQTQGIPRGNYAIFLSDNYINKLSASGHQDNSLETNDIIRDGRE
ncbi:DUF1672 family protein [Salipaludibacillus sp. HK11]|uniref:DUF1672 family protein n=1 Tax=Salipaludibacillus sp. HK11 TaxID=3394320 RepID=UPI0039FC11D9